MRYNLHLTAAAYLLAASSVQAGPLRWKRAFWERDEVSTPGELPTLPPPTTLPSTAPASPASTPSTTTILNSTPSTTTIEQDPTTTPAVADHGPGSDEIGFDPDATPRPIFSTLTEDIPNGLRDPLSSTDTLLGGPTPITTTGVFTIPAPNQSSLEMQPIPDSMVPTPEPSTESLLSSSSSSSSFSTPPPSSMLTSSKALTETPGSSFETPTSVEPVQPSSLTSVPPFQPTPTSIITTTITPEDPTQTPVPGRNSTLPGAGSPNGAPSEVQPEEPTLTATSTSAASDTLETPPASTPPVQQSPEKPSTYLAPSIPSTSVVQNPAAPSEDAPAPQPTQQPPQSPIESSSSTSQTLDLTSNVLTQTIGAPSPDVTQDTTVEPEISSTTEIPEPTTTTTLKQSQTLTITQSPTSDINPAIPTAEIQTTTMSVSPERWEANLATAKEINKIYDSLSPDMACAEGQVACISGKLAQCAFGTFDIQSCKQDMKCFALPSETIDGVTVGCFSTKYAEGVLRGEIVPGSSSTSTTKVVAQPTKQPQPETPEQDPEQSDVVEPTTSRTTTSVVIAEPTKAPAPAPPVNTYFGTEPMFTEIVPITGNPGSQAPPAQPTGSNSDSGGDDTDDKPPVPEAENGEDDGNRTTQVVNGTPTVSVTVTVTVASVTVTKAGVTTTITQKETETVTVGSSGDRVDTVSIRN